MLRPHDSSTDLSFLEQPRRFRLARPLTLLLLLGVGAGVGWGLLRSGRGERSASPVEVPEPTGITLEVLNGTGRAGLARVATRELRRRGFDVVYFGTAGERVAATEVLVRRGEPGAAERVARALGVGRVRVALDTLLRLDVTVLLGEDYPAKN